MVRDLELRQDVLDELEFEPSVIAALICLSSIPRLPVVARLSRRRVLEGEPLRPNRPFR